MTSINFYKRDTLIKRIENQLKQINQRFDGWRILSVTDNGDYVTVKNRGVYIADYDTQKLFDALENFSEEDSEFLFPYDLWDYLDHCKYTPENQESDNKLKTDDKLSFCWVLALDDWTISSIPQSQTINTEAFTLSKLVEELKTKNEILEKKIKDLESSVWLLQQENKQLKNQSDELKKHFMDIYDFVDSNEIEIS